MGTSLSGLTPATTFDGLLKVGDNDPLTATLKPISTGDGTDTMLELSTTALQIGGATGMYWDNTNKRLGIGTDAPSTPFEVYGAVRFRNDLNLNGRIINTSSGLVNIVDTAYFDALNDRLGIGESIPTSRLHIKGSGATSATTSLLVQNSAGSELLKVTDDGAIDFGVLGLDFSNDGSGGTMSVASDRYIKLASSLSTYSALSAHLFKTFDGSAYSEAMRITGNTNQFVGIGESTPTARLHIKGSGATIGTTALLVQNSAGSQLFKVSDNAQIDFNGNVYVNSDYKIIGRNAQNSIRYAAGELRLNIQGTASNHRYHIYDSSSATSFFEAFSQSKKIGINLNAGSDTNVNAQLHIKGSGNTATTTALLVQNSDGLELLSLDDIGGVRLGGDGNTTTKANIKLDGYTGLFNVTNAKFGNWNGSAYAVFSGLAKTDALFAFGNDATTASTRMHIKGLGATSATTALLVQNSAGTDLMSVTDDGKVKLGTSSSIVELNSGYNNRFQQNRLSFYSTNTNIRGINAGGQGLIVSKSTGTSDLYPTAILAVDSTTQGFLPPRMADSERDAITSPATGLMIYDTTNNQMNYFNGSNWVAF